MAPLPDLPKGSDLLVPAEEAAGYLGLAAATLARWRLQGKYLPFVKFGSGKGQVRYRLRDLQTFIEASLRRSTSEEPPALGRAVGLVMAGRLPAPRGGHKR